VLPDNLQSVVQQQKHVSKLLRGCDYSAETSLRVINAALSLQESYLRKKQKLPVQARSKVPAAKVRETVCTMFGISPPTYSKITNSYFKEKRICSSGTAGEGRSGNATPKARRVPITKATQIAVREFVRHKQHRRERVTARQVLDFFIEKKYLNIILGDDGKFDPKAFNTAYRNVRAWLEACNYRRGKRHGNIVPDASLTVKRHDYLQKFFENRNAPPESRLREVYLDESYIHEHYHRNDDSIWDPSDEQDVRFKKDPAKGRRYCFAAAIQGPNPRVEEPQTDADKAGLVPGSVWSFCPQKKSDHHGDYHKVFNSENFLTWWKKLLTNLHQPSLIITGNAAYHRVYGEHVPKPAQMKKAECIVYLKDKNIDVDETSSRLQLQRDVREYIKTNEKIEIVRLAEEEGHKVLFTPPYHSDLQPIELTWAFIKGNVGRQYSVNSTLELVHRLLKLEFKELEEKGHKRVLGWIEHCARTAQTFYDEIPMDEDAAEGNEEEDEENEEDVDEMIVDDDNSPQEDTHVDVELHGIEIDSQLGPTAIV
jgi:hypothetical protein